MSVARHSLPGLAATRALVAAAPVGDAGSEKQRGSCVAAWQGPVTAPPVRLEPIVSVAMAGDAPAPFARPRVADRAQEAVERHGCVAAGPVLGSHGHIEQLEGGV